MVAEEADGGAAELAIGGLSVQLVVPQRLERHTHVHQMLLSGREEVSSQYTCTNRPSVGAPEPGGQRAGRAARSIRTARHSDRKSNP